MTSLRRIEANRRNARLSTGPRTRAGKARSAQNARRHGLSLAAAGDPAWAGGIAKLARLIAGPDATPHRLALAAAVAAAQIDVMRVRRARCELWPSDPGAAGAIRRLAALDRYERRALARRSRAMDALEADLDAVGKTNPTQESAARRLASRAQRSRSRAGQPTRSRPTWMRPALAHAESSACAESCADAGGRPRARRAIDALEADCAVGKTNPTRESAASPANCRPARRIRGPRPCSWARLEGRPNESRCPSASMLRDGSQRRPLRSSLRSATSRARRASRRDRRRRAARRHRRSPRPAPGCA